MAGISDVGLPEHVDGPGLVAAASGLMLLPTNASRYLRLHRLAALGMAMESNDAKPLSPSTIRALLKRNDIGGPSVLMGEDPYSELLVQSISFTGGPYLVSGGSGEGTIADLENLLDSIFRESWMPEGLRSQARLLVQGLLTISDMVLKRAGLSRGTEAGQSPGTPVDVPGANGLKHLTDATLITNEDLESQGSWLRMVIDTFAHDPGELVDPCSGDYSDERLYVAPFLRLAEGYRVVLPLDLAICIRFHLLRFAKQEGQLAELGKRWRDAVLRRVRRCFPSSANLEKLERNETLCRYLIKIDSKRELHLIIATDPLTDWDGELWGHYDSNLALESLFDLISPDSRADYSSAEELVHVVVIDSPGRSAFWGVPNVDGADPVILARSDVLEVIFHEEPDGLLGLLLFAQAIANRPGESFSFSILDEFSSYLQAEKSFYLSDDMPPTFISFQAGDGVSARSKYWKETDRHGVPLPTRARPILQVQRRYRQDAPEIFITEPNSSYLGSVVEFNSFTVFITIDHADKDLAGMEFDLLDCVAYWVRECAVLLALQASANTTELVLRLSDAESWTKVQDWATLQLPVRSSQTDRGFELEFTETFVAHLQQRTNTAERELVAVLLRDLFEVDAGSLDSAVDAVAPAGLKRMINVFHQSNFPDMLAARLPRPLTGHRQVDAQTLDELGQWLGSVDGGGYSMGPVTRDARVAVLNAAVGYLFTQLEDTVARFDRQILLDYLVSQNESLLHTSKLNATLLKYRLACFGEQSHTVSELVEFQRELSTTHRANRFLIEYVAAQPPSGSDSIEHLDYYRLLSYAKEIGSRGTLSDFLHHGIADFEVSVLESGRLGVGRDDPVMLAADKYASNSGMRSVRNALSVEKKRAVERFDLDAFLAESESAMHAEFGFSLTQLREVCGGLLDLAEADRLTRVDYSSAVNSIAEKRELPDDTVSTVLAAIVLTQRTSFLGIGPDAWPWRFNRDASYIRRPLVRQGDDLVFGFRGVYRLSVFWADSLLSGRFQGRAKSSEMRQFISQARGKVNAEFVRSVAARLNDLGLEVQIEVKKIGRSRINGSDGKELGDIDVLALHPPTRTVFAVEVKDFEIARTPIELANEIEKLFVGTRKKKSTIELHARRVDWLKEHLDEVIASVGHGETPGTWKVVGAVVTSDPLLTPLVNASPFPVIPFEDLDLDALRLQAQASIPSKNRKSRK